MLTAAPSSRTTICSTSASNGVVRAFAQTSISLATCCPKLRPQHNIDQDPGRQSPLTIMPDCRATRRLGEPDAFLRVIENTSRIWQSGVGFARGPATKTHSTGEATL